MPTHSRTLLLCALAFLAACDRKKPAPPAKAAEAPPMVATVIKGKVQERIDTAPYSYLRLATDKGDVWAAVPLTKVLQGSEVTVTQAVPMLHFESKTLKRTFELVFFGTLQEQASAAANSGIQHALAAQGPSDVAVPRLDKAPGSEGRTVGEVYAKRQALQGKTVAIHGQVVKVNREIMGKNWIHLRDGSGEGATADITLTTSDVAAVGEVVIAKGTIRLDKDFGAGYRYSVIIEDAKLSPDKR